MIAILVVGLALAFDRTRRPVLMRKLATIGVAGLTLVVVLALVVSPQWLTTGRFHTIIWTRATQSLGINPNLPIADLNKIYPCQKYVPEGIPAGIGDQGGGCIWRAYVIEHKISENALWDKTYGGEFESVMRNAFFRIVMKYPWQTFQTFVYYKPKAIIGSIEYDLQFNLSGAPPSSIVLVLTSLGIALFAATKAPGIGREIAVVLLAALFNSAAYIVAYANPGTTGDLLLCCLIVTGLALGAIFSGATKLVYRLSRKVQAVE